jgi:hypothetical protein
MTRRTTIPPPRIRSPPPPPSINPNVYLQNAWEQKTREPATVSLCIQYYIDKERQAELNFCMDAHIRNRYVDRLIVIKSNCVIWPTELNHSKITFVNMEERPTFQQMIAILDEYPGVHIIANTDICFDETIQHAAYLQGKDVLALNRWELKEPLEIFSAVAPTHRDAYDVWIWKDRLQLVSDATFSTGIPGCDNRFCYLLHQAGYRLCNPWSTIKAYHVHNSGIRRYSQAHRIAGPYAFPAQGMAAPFVKKPLCILINCFFNVNDVKRTLESLEADATSIPYDVIFLENPSKYSPNMKALALEKGIYQHYICSDNIEGNIWQLFLQTHPEITQQYKYIALSEGDVVLDKNALQEAVHLLDNSAANVGNVSIEFHFDTEKYKTLPIRAWVPLPQQRGPYSVGATGFQFIIFKPAFLMDFITCIQQKKLASPIALGVSYYTGISDQNLLEFNRRRGTLWIRTVHAKLDHIGWEHYLGYDEYCAEKDKNLKAGKIRQNINVANYKLTRLL